MSKTKLTKIHSANSTADNGNSDPALSRTDARSQGDLTAAPSQENRAPHMNGQTAHSAKEEIVAASNNKVILSAETTDKVKELVRLAQEQGYLTYNDINDALPDSVASPDEIEEIISQLRNLEVEIVDQASVDRIKQVEREEDDEKARLDILDDPVRMYLKQMGQVPLLTREQEVEISKRIEVAENEVKHIIYGFGFAAKEQIALAEKLTSEPPKERFDRVILDKKIDSRESHLKQLRKLVKNVRELDQRVDVAWAQERNANAEAKGEFKKLDKKLQNTFSKFF